MFSPDAKYMATANDTAAWAAGGRLFSVVVGTSAGSAVVTVYNGTATTDPVTATIDASAKGNYEFGGARHPAGLFIKLTGGNAKVTAVGL